MKMLATLTPKAGVAPDQFAPLSEPEERRVWELYTAGAVREMYFQPRPIRVGLVLEVSDHADARQLIESLPMVKAGLFDIDVWHLGPWRPIEVLFANGAVR